MWLSEWSKIDIPLQAVKKYYGHFSELVATLQVGFEGSDLTLDIPEDGLVTKEGWRITPLNPPTVSVAFLPVL